MITSVTFDDTIPYAVDRRESRFTSEDGWTITEPCFGRITLVRDGACVVVQSMPYTLSIAEVPMSEDVAVEYRRLRAEAPDAAKVSSRIVAEANVRAKRGRP